MMKRTNVLIVVGLGLALGAAGCKKSESSGSGGASSSGAASASASAKAPDPQPTPPPAPPAPADTADYLKVSAENTDPTKPSVEVTFASWKIVSASFDPANLEGGTAEIEVDPASLSSGIAKRDAHLKNPDYLDVVAFPAATVRIANVKRTGEKTYTADATVKIHGVEKTWSLPFEVVSSTADAVQVTFTQPFSRLDFDIGKPESEDSSKAQVVLRGRLTVKKT